MAKIRVETIREFDLELSEGEESKRDRTIRERLFKELHRGLHPDMEAK